jgi:hypothetical protein
MADEKMSEETGNYRGKDAQPGEIIKKFTSGRLQVEIKRVK